MAEQLSTQDHQPYELKISRPTVEKLGVKLYDKASAVLAELIANAHDADATEVEIRAPMGEYLARKAGGSVTDKGYEITIKDDGIGMTPAELASFYLVVGSDRRADSRRGPRSRGGRAVMGRKGVGKLAPFGICNEIEIISAGKRNAPNNRNKDAQHEYQIAHIILDYQKILEDDDAPYRPEIGKQDGQLTDHSGTTVVLRRFNYRRVPDMEILSRQIAQRFGGETKNWVVRLQNIDDRGQEVGGTRIVDTFQIDVKEETRVRFGRTRQDSSSIVTKLEMKTEDIESGFTIADDATGTFYPVTGWLAYSKKSHGDEIEAGVRIYCRNKIAAQTAAFNLPAGFTGEHDVRSYLVGELNADWLDENEDLILTDRRDILWSHELGEAFQKWGQQVIKRFASAARPTRQQTTLSDFLKTGDFEARVLQAFPSDTEESIRVQARKFAERIGKSVSPGDATDPAVVTPLIDLIIAFAPHVSLHDLMNAAAESSESLLASIVHILETAKVAETYAFGIVIKDRLAVIDQLETLIDDEATDEPILQRLIQSAQWLINPTWTPLVANQPLRSFKRAFVRYVRETHRIELNLDDFSDENRRPDFVMTSQEGKIEVIEIKRPGHALTDEELDRIRIYHKQLEEFLVAPQHEEFTAAYSGHHITVICDHLALSGLAADAFAYLQRADQGALTHISWATFLKRTKDLHNALVSEDDRKQTS